MMARSSSPRINGKVVPDGKPSGSCEGLSFICILVATPRTGILRQGSSEWLNPSSFYVSFSHSLSWLSQMLPSLTLSVPSSWPVLWLCFPSFSLGFRLREGVATADPCSFFYGCSWHVCPGAVLHKTWAISCPPCKTGGLPSLAVWSEAWTQYW